MTIFLNNIKRILRRKLNIIFMLIVPVVMISFVGSLGNVSSMVRCGVVDYDDTGLTQGLIRSLESKASIRFIKEDEVQSKIFGQHVDIALVIDKGFTDGILNGNEVKIRIMSLQENDASIPVKMSINSYVNAAVNISETVSGNEERFYEAMKVFENGAIRLDAAGVDSRGNEIGTRKAQMGFLVMGMLFLSSFAALIMLEDKEKKVYYRILSGPLKVSQYMLQSLLSFFTVMVLQVVLIFLFMSLLLKVDFGINIIGMIGVSMIFSLMCVALGVCINSVSKDTRQSSLFMSLFLSPMCMLGGCWWPTEFMPSLLRKIAQFVPTTWIMKAYEKILKGGSIVAVLSEIIVLLSFTLVFFLFASWRRVDIAK